MPSTPLDAYGLLLSSIEDPNPVMFLKPKALLRVRGEESIPGEPSDEEDLKSRIDAPIGEARQFWTPNWPDLQYLTVPIGFGRIVKEGHDATIVTYGRMVGLCKDVAIAIEKTDGTCVEVLDLRSIYPYDWSLIKKSVSKTKRVLFVNEDTEVTNFAEHLAYRVVQDLFYELLARPKVLCAKNVPGVGLALNLENATIPTKEDILEALNGLLNEIP